MGQTELLIALDILGKVTGADLASVVESSTHPNDCRCLVCLKYLLALGPEKTDDGYCYAPFSKAEYIAAGGILPLDESEL